MCWPGFPAGWSPPPLRAHCSRRWGAAVGYPGIVLDEPGGDIHGFIFSSEELSADWARLDEFEGDGYERVVTSAGLEDGTVVRTHIYALKRKNSA